MNQVALASLTLLVAIGGTVLLIPKPEPSERLYQGKPAIAWALDLNSPSLAVRETGGDVLRSLGPDALPALLRLLQTPDPVLARPVKVIGWQMPEKVRGALFHLIDPYSAAAQRAAAAQAFRALATNAQPAVPALSRALHDDATVAWHSALALAQLGPPGIAALTQALTNTGPAQCGFVCYALSTQGQSASNAVPALASLIAKGSPELSEKATSALSAIGAPALSALIHALSSPAVQIRTQVIDALARLGPLAREAIPNLFEIARNDQPKVRVAAVDAVAQIRPTAAPVIAVLAEALSDPVRAVRLKAIEGLSRSPRTCRDALATVIRALKDESPDIRGQAAALLGEMGSSAQGIPALEQALKDENETVRSKVRVALDQLNQRSSS